MRLHLGALHPVSGDPDSPPAVRAAGVTFPHGLFDFTLGGCAPGSTITMTITYPSRCRAPLYWKYGPTPSSPVRTGTSCLEPLRRHDGLRDPDGGLGDDDLAANGIIVDQGGPGVGSAAHGIPMLSPWMLALLGLLLAGFALRRAR
jgi:hypothetical protein